VQIADNVPSDFAVVSNRIYVVVVDGTAKVSTITYVPTNAAAGTAATPFATIPNEQCNAIQSDAATGDLFLSCVDYTSSLEYARHITSTGGAGTRINQINVNGSGTVPVYPMSGNLYWFEFPGGTVPNGVRTSKFDGSGLTTLQTYATADTFWSVLGVDSNSVFIWQTVSGVQSLRQVAFTGTSTITLFNNAFSQAGFASDGTTAFWWVGLGGVYSVPKGTLTANMNTVFADATLAVMGPIDATSVYYATEVDAVTGATGCSSYRIAKRPKAGGTEAPLFDGVDSCIGAMKGDANVVVWRNRGRGCGTMTCTNPLLKLAK
jgi:hypothetical protein